MKNLLFPVGIPICDQNGVHSAMMHGDMLFRIIVTGGENL